MSLHASQTIAEYCKEAAGSYLRTVFHYDNGDPETLFIRDDVDEQYAEAELAHYFRLLSATAADEGDQTDALHVGNHHGTLRLYDDALLLNFPQGDGIGTLIALDPEAGREIATFVTRCLARLHESSEQEIQNAPDWDWL